MSQSRRVLTILGSISLLAPACDSNRGEDSSALLPEETPPQCSFGDLSLAVAATRVGDDVEARGFSQHGAAVFHDGEPATLAFDDGVAVLVSASGVPSPLAADEARVFAQVWVDCPFWCDTAIVLTELDEEQPGKLVSALWSGSDDPPRLPGLSVSYAADDCQTQSVCATETTLSLTVWTDAGSAVELQAGSQQLVDAYSFGNGRSTRIDEVQCTDQPGAWYEGFVLSEGACCPRRL